MGSQRSVGTDQSAALCRAATRIPGVPFAGALPSLYAVLFSNGFDDLHRCELFLGGYAQLCLKTELLRFQAFQNDVLFVFQGGGEQITVAPLFYFQFLAELLHR